MQKRVPWQIVSVFTHLSFPSPRKTLQPHPDDFRLEHMELSEMKCDICQF